MSDEVVGVPATAASTTTTTSETSVKVSTGSPVQSMLLVGVVAGLMYFLYQLGDMFSKVQSFEIYTTPPGIGEILKLLATVVGIVAMACGLNVRAAITNVVSSFTTFGGSR